MAMARSSSGGGVIRYGFMDNIIFAHKPRLLDVAPPLQLKRSAHAALGLAVSCVVCSDTSCRPTGARDYFSGACTRGVESVVFLQTKDCPVFHLQEHCAADQRLNQLVNHYGSQ